MRFQKYQPCPHLAHIVAYFWTLECSSKELGASYRFVPDGFLEWIFHVKTPWKYRFAGQTEVGELQSHLIGQFKSYLELEMPATQFQLFGIKFFPWTATGFWGIDINESTEKYIPLEDLPDKKVSTLKERILAAGSVKQWIKLAENYLVSRLADQSENDLQKLITPMQIDSRSLDLQNFVVGKRRIEQRFKEEIGLSRRPYSAPFESTDLFEDSDSRIQAHLLRLPTRPAFQTSHT